MTKTSRIIVLNDGETFTLASGCALIELPSDVTDEEIKRATFIAASRPNHSIIEVLRDEWRHSDFCGENLTGGTNVFNIEVIARF